jgi:hypothetical protein
VEIFLEDEFWIHGDDYFLPAAIGKYALTYNGGTIHAVEFFDRSSWKKFRRPPEIFRSPMVILVEDRIHTIKVHKEILSVRIDSGLEVDAHIVGQV